MALLHSTFLQALSLTLIDSLWQFALLWLLYISCQFIFKLSSSQKYSVALFSSLVGFIWFIVTFIYHFSKNTSEPFLPALPLSQYTDLTNISNYLLPVLSIIYIGLLVLNGVKWALSYIEVVRIRKTGLSKIPVEWRLFVNELSQHLSINKHVRIYLSSLVNTPMTVGYLKPLILIPLASLNHLTKEQMEAVILHELAHIKRLDYLFNIILSIAEAVLFFNPFMHLLIQDVKKEREHCCDDLVLQFQYNPSTYAQALLNIATTTHSPSFALHAASKKNILLERIQRIIGNKTTSRRNYKHQVVALFFIFINCFSFNFFATTTKKIGIAQNIRSSKMAENTTAINNSNPTDIIASNVVFQHVDKPISAANTLHISDKLKATPKSTKNIVTNDRSENNTDIYANNLEHNNEVKIIHAVNNEQQMKTHQLQTQLEKDISIVNEQAKQANKSLDEITIKTMMLARVRKMIAENETVNNLNESVNKNELILLEKRLANNILHNVLESNQCRIEKAKDKITFHYYLPEDENGNHYSFEYIINQTEKEIAENNVVKKETALQPANSKIEKQLTDTLVQHHLKTIRI